MRIPDEIYVNLEKEFEEGRHETDTGKDKVLSMLGLAARSRNVVSGGFATEQAVKCGKASLVIIAEDASGNTRKKYSNMCDFYEVPCAFPWDESCAGTFHGQG